MIYIFLADGFEEIEAITPIDVIRRAGLEIQSVCVHEDRLDVEGAHGITVRCDIGISELKAENTEMIILPGGMTGVENLSECSSLSDIIDLCVSEDKYICAICAAPTILASKGLLKGKKATCYPSMAEEIIECGAKYKNNPVCRDGKIITSAGPGTAAEFSFAIVKELLTSYDADKLRISMIYGK